MADRFPIKGLQYEQDWRQCWTSNNQNYLASRRSKAQNLIFWTPPLMTVNSTTGGGGEKGAFHVSCLKWSAEHQPPNISSDLLSLKTVITVHCDHI